MITADQRAAVDRVVTEAFDDRSLRPVDRYDRAREKIRKLGLQEDGYQEAVGILARAMLL